MFSSLLSGWGGLRAKQVLAITEPGLFGTIERLEFLAPLRLVDLHRTGIDDAVLEVPEQAVDLGDAGEFVHSGFQHASKRFYLLPRADLSWPGRGLFNWLGILAFYQPAPPKLDT